MAGEGGGGGGALLRVWNRSPPKRARSFFFLKFSFHFAPLTNDHLSCFQTEITRCPPLSLFPLSWPAFLNKTILPLSSLLCDIQVRPTHQSIYIYYRVVVHSMYCSRYYPTYTTMYYPVFFLSWVIRCCCFAGWSGLVHLSCLVKVDLARAGRRASEHR